MKLHLRIQRKTLEVVVLSSMDASTSKTQKFACSQGENEYIYQRLHAQISDEYTARTEPKFRSDSSRIDSISQRTDQLVAEKVPARNLKDEEMEYRHDRIEMELRLYAHGNTRITSNTQLGFKGPDNEDVQSMCQGIWVRRAN